MSFRVLGSHILQTELELPPKLASKLAAACGQEAGSEEWLPDTLSEIVDAVVTLRSLREARGCWAKLVNEVRFQLGIDGPIEAEVAATNIACNAEELVGLLNWVEKVDGDGWLDLPPSTPRPIERVLTIQALAGLPTLVVPPWQVERLEPGREPDLYAA